MHKNMPPNIPYNMKNELTKLYEFRNILFEYYQEIGKSENYFDNLNELSDYLKEKVDVSLVPEFSKDIEKLKEFLNKACKGDMLRKDIRIEIDEFNKKVDEYVVRKEYIIAEKFLEGAKTQEEIIKRVGHLLRCLINGKL